jgi:hypothetical protein
MLNILFIFLYCAVRRFRLKTVSTMIHTTYLNKLLNDIKYRHGQNSEIHIFPTAGVSSIYRINVFNNFIPNQ